MGRDRSQAIVARGDKILMVKHTMDGRYFYCLPGGGIEDGETPAEAALRELKEEACVDGTVVMEVNILFKANNKGCVHSFWIDIPEDAVPGPGVDPELAPEEQTIVGAEWMRLEEMSELDQIYLWTSGLKTLPAFYEKMQQLKK